VQMRARVPSGAVGGNAAWCVAMRTQRALCAAMRGRVAQRREASPACAAGVAQVSHNLSRAHSPRRTARA
jgi:hypothetical protein